MKGVGLGRFEIILEYITSEVPITNLSGGIK